MKSAVHFTFSRGEPMIKKTLVNVGVAALLGGMALAAQAAGITLNLDFATKGLAGPSDSGYVGPMTVGVPNTTNIAVGGLRGTALSDSPFGTSFYTYCVQLTQTFQVNTPTNPYFYVGGASYFGSVLPTLPAASSVVGRLNTLFSSLVSPVPTSTLQSAAIQLAVWEAVYEGTSNYGNVDRNALGTAEGAFSAVNNGTSSAAIVEANKILASALAYTGPLKFTLGVLRNESKQDFLVLDGGGFTSGFVPEPTSLALAFGALGALGFATRRRQSAKA